MLYTVDRSMAQRQIQLQVQPTTPSPSHKSHLPRLLRLNPSLRHRIYEYLDVPGGTDSELADHGPRRVFNLSNSRQGDQSQLGVHGLLLSCRQLYQELSQLLYSTNSFAIDYSNLNSLAALRNLRPQTCASLTSLRIILAASSCHFSGSVTSTDPEWVYGDACGSRMDEDGSNDLHDEPIVSSDPRLAEWDSTASYLATTLSEGMVDLAVVCDVRDGDQTTPVQAARVVTASLLRLPKLRHCSLRLCRSPNPELKQLAHETTLRARHMIPPSSSWTPATLETPPPGPSRFLALPIELRQRILQFTDLITPWTEVHWSPQDGRRFVLGSTYCENHEHRDQICPPSRHHGCHFLSCERTYPRPTPGCFCGTYHSASSSSIACRCWAPPTALFLVCKTLYKDAQSVFFSGNRFVVFDRQSHLPWKRDVDWDDEEEEAQGYLNQRFGASRFLRDIVPTDSLRYLRFLELVYPAWDAHIWPLEGQPCLGEWIDTLAWARDHGLNGAGLTVRMVAMDASDWEQPLSRKLMTPEQGVQVIAGYMRLIGCLGKDLKQFYAQLVSPWRWTEGERGSENAVAITERKLKEKAERSVMGNRYLPSSDSREPEESVWHHRFERDA